MDFTTSPSPSPEVVFVPYSPTLYPKFQAIFEATDPDSPLHFLAQPPEEATRAAVLENRADKDITALRYQWSMTLEDGTTRKSTVSSDSYLVDVYRPVLKQGDRQLICLSATIDESLLEHILNGGGCMGSGSHHRSLAGVTSIHLEIETLLFADGELAGPDTSNYMSEIRLRKPAAEYIAKQIRSAAAEGRDVAPVLVALAEIPRHRDDFLASWIRRYAADSMSRAASEFQREAHLRYLESRPTLPEIYRRGNRPSK